MFVIGWFLNVGGSGYEEAGVREIFTQASSVFAWLLPLTLCSGDVKIGMPCMI